MELVLNRSDELFAFIFDNEICGIFSLTKSGLVLCDFALQTDDVFLLLKSHFFCKKVQVIFGKSDSVQFATKAYCEANKKTALSTKNGIFMRFNTVFNPLSQKNVAKFSLRQNILSQFQVKICSEKMENQLAKHYFSYLEEEVVPAGKSVNRAAERFALHKALCQKRVWALFSASGEFCAMAFVRAVGKNARLLGGIYTPSPFRRRGFASALVYAVSDYFKHAGVVATLYVDCQNAAAVSCYTSAGFVPRSKCQTVYF